MTDRLMKSARTPELEIRSVRLAQIRTERQPWHVRRSYEEGDVQELTDAIRHTRSIEPLEVIPGSDGQYLLVSGWLRWLALDRLVKEGYSDLVPVRVLAKRDSAELLQHLYLNGAARYPLRMLEVGWIMHSLERLLREKGEPHERADVCRRLGLVGKSKKSLASEAWTAAEAIPLSLAEETEAVRGIPVDALGKIPRRALREIGRVHSEALEVVREALFEALEEGRPVVDAVREARRAIEAGGPAVETAGVAQETSDVQGIHDISKTAATAEMGGPCLALARFEAQHSHETRRWRWLASWVQRLTAVIRTAFRWLSARASAIIHGLIRGSWSRSGGC